MFGNDFCNRCGLPGHIRRDCSLSWRRYVFVREPSAFEVERAITMLAPQCYNCAAPSHYGDECPHRRRAVEWSIFHTPNLEFLQQASHLPQERQARASPKRKYEGDQHPPPPHRRNYIRGEREEERDRGYYRSRERGDSSSRRDHGRRHHEGSSYAYHRPTREHVTERRDETVYRRHSLAKERDVLPQSHHYHSDSQQSESRKGVSVPGRGHFRKQSLNPEPRQPQVEPPTLSPIISRRRRG